MTPDVRTQEEEEELVQELGQQSVLGGGFDQ